ncbi:hypothetical protein H6801_00800 [Candidatus Nomurabacteria bacterium]|nr:hypothetical protein [Candidatus Saccharibacteria bacterium]MCB9821901.1 hypothetical protein [Candidatus Nomurabacteria bacterium]
MLNRLKRTSKGRGLETYIKDISVWKRASEALGAIAAAHRCIADETTGKREVIRSGNIADISRIFDPRTNDNSAQRYLDTVKRQPSHVKVVEPQIGIASSDLSETI